MTSGELLRHNNELSGLTKTVEFFPAGGKLTSWKTLQPYVSSNLIRIDATGTCR